MSATKEITYDSIMLLRKKIDEASSKGEDISSLNQELEKLTENWQKQLLVESSSGLIKG